MLRGKSSATEKSAIQDFKNSCLKETVTEKLFDPLRNLISTSVIHFDNEFRENENELKKNFFDDIYFFSFNNFKKLVLFVFIMSNYIFIG